MMKNNILEYLDEVIPNPRCELNYHTDYELLIATMLSAQTTDKRVNQVTEVLFNKYPNLDMLSKADINDLIDIIRPLGNYHKKAINVKEIAIRLKDIDVIPNDRTFIESLPGVGRKTANVFLANIYDEPVMAVDTHIERISKRLGIAKKNDSVRTTEDKLTKYFKGCNINRLHHQLLLFGRYHCKSINPLCDNCKLKSICKKR